MTPKERKKIEKILSQYPKTKTIPITVERISSSTEMEIIGYILEETRALYVSAEEVNYYTKKK